MPICPARAGGDDRCPALIVRASDPQIGMAEEPDPERGEEELLPVLSEADIETVSDRLLQISPADPEARGRVAAEIERIIRHEKWAESAGARRLMERSVAEIGRAAEGSSVAAELRVLRKAVAKASPPRRFMPRILDYRVLHPLLKRITWLPPFLSVYLTKFRNLREVLDGTVTRLRASMEQSEIHIQEMFDFSTELSATNASLKKYHAFLRAVVEAVERKMQSATYEPDEVAFLRMMVLDPCRRSADALAQLRAGFVKSYVDLLKVIQIAEQLRGQAQAAIVFTIPVLTRTAAVVVSASQERERIHDLQELQQTTAAFIREATRSVQELQLQLDRLLEGAPIEHALAEASVRRIGANPSSRWWRWRR